jgi:hypothetical protein
MSLVLKRKFDNFLECASVSDLCLLIRMRDRLNACIRNVVTLVEI